MQEAMKKKKPDLLTSEDFYKWFETWYNSVAKASYRLKSQDFDPEQSYKKYFKRLMDFYD